MRRIRTVVRLILPALILVLSTAAVSAPTLWLSIEELATQATYIVEGRILDVRGEWNSDRTQIFSIVRFAVANNMKNEFPLPEVTMKVLGGEIPAEQIGMALPELPRFVAGDNMILFLGANPQTPFPVIGQTQGAIHLVADPATGAPMAVSQEGIAIPKADFVARVQQAVQK